MSGIRVAGNAAETLGGVVAVAVNVAVGVRPLRVRWGVALVVGVPPLSSAVTIVVGVASGVSVPRLASASAVAVPAARRAEVAVALTTVGDGAPLVCVGSVVGEGGKAVAVLDGRGIVVAVGVGWGPLPQAPSSTNKMSSPHSAHVLRQSTSCRTSSTITMTIFTGPLSKQQPVARPRRCCLHQPHEKQRAAQTGQDEHGLVNPLHAQCPGREVIHKEGSGINGWNIAQVDAQRLGRNLHNFFRIGDGGGVVSQGTEDDRNGQREASNTGKDRSDPAW